METWQFEPVISAIVHRPHVVLESYSLSGTEIVKGFHMCQILTWLYTVGDPSWTASAVMFRSEHLTLNIAGPLFN